MVLGKTLKGLTLFLHVLSCLHCWLTLTTLANPPEYPYRTTPELDRHTSQQIIFPSNRKS